MTFAEMREGETELVDDVDPDTVCSIMSVEAEAVGDLLAAVDLLEEVDLLLVALSDVKLKPALRHRFMGVEAKVFAYLKEWNKK